MHYLPVACQFGFSLLGTAGLSGVFPADEGVPDVGVGLVAVQYGRPV